MPSGANRLIGNIREFNRFYTGIIELVHGALCFCRKRGYRRVFLLTTSAQRKDSAMYVRAGFRKTEEKPASMRGVQQVRCRAATAFLLPETSLYFFTASSVRATKSWTPLFLISS